MALSWQGLPICKCLIHVVMASEFLLLILPLLTLVGFLRHHQDGI